MIFTDLVIIALAACAVTFIWRYIPGPFGIFDAVQYWAKYVDIQDSYGKIIKSIADLVSCYWCFGFWVSVGMYYLYIYYPEIVNVFCILGIVGLLHEWIAK
jgi:hypothetical protein